MSRRRGRTGTRTDVPRLARWTVLGTVGAPGAVAADAAGRIVTGRVGWSLDWEILTGERRVVPREEATLRQRAAAADGPVPAGLETALRTGGGDVSHTVYVCLAPAAGDGALGVLEIRNLTSAPVAVRLTLRPGDFWRPDGLWRLQADATGVLVNGRPGLWWERPPPEAHLAADFAGESDAAGGAALQPPGRVSSRRGGAGASLTWPVTHGTGLRVLLPLQAAGGQPPAPASVPVLGQVSRGWEAHAAQGLRVGGLAGDRIGAVAGAAVRRLLALEVHAGRRDGIDGSLLPADRALVASALAVAGFPRQAAEVVSARAARDPAALARTARREAARHRETWGGGAAAIGAMAASAGVGGGWSSGRSGDDPAIRAAFLLGLRDLLVAERGNRLDLLSHSAVADLRDARAPVEVHGLGTGRGRLSFALRWHDATPALLWELSPPRTRLESWAADVAAGREGPAGRAEPSAVRMTATGLAPDWSAAEPTGEALLRA